MANKSKIEVIEIYSSPEKDIKPATHVIEINDSPIKKRIISSVPSTTTTHEGDDDQIYSILSDSDESDNYEDNEFDEFGAQKAENSSVRITSAKMDMDLFYDIECKHVKELPFDIDGLCHFQLECDPTNIMKSSKDGRRWKTWCTSNRKQHPGVRRRARCGGSWKCPNEDCLFLKNKGSPNNVQFTDTKNGKNCFICEEEAIFVSCQAIKVWEFSLDKKLVDIYHCGLHTCRAIPNRRDLEVERKLKDDFTKHSSLRPSEAVANTMLCALKEGNTWEEIDALAESLADSRRVKDTKAKAKKSLESHGHSFDALCEFKKFCDDRDPYLLYRFNDERQNGNNTFVFKCSRFQANLAISMDCEKSGLLHDQYCYADATHKRCPGFKTITLWVYHPLLRKLVKLATMESTTEDTEAMVQFWSLFNEVLQGVSGDKNYVFNPTGWVLDEAGAEWNAIRIVFGEDAMANVVSCEFHYKQSVGRKSVKLNDAHKAEFEALAYALLEASTVSVFEKMRANLNRFIKNNPAYSNVLTSWVEWWNNRKTHIFRAFKNTVKTPHMNMAETGHSTWVKSGAIKLTLVDAARHDVGENIRLEKTIQGFMEGSLKSSGKGPSVKETERRERESQIKRAREFGEEVLNENFEGDPYSANDAYSVLDPKATHSPTKRGKTSNDKRSQRKQKSSTKSWTKQELRIISTTKSEASQMGLTRTVKIASDHVKFIVTHGENTYDVDICHTPSCSCPDNRPCLCKHILWVYLYILDVKEDSSLLHEKKLTKDVLQSTLSKVAVQRSGNTASTSNKHQNLTQESGSHQAFANHPRTNSVCSDNDDSVSTNPARNLQERTGSQGTRYDRSNPSFDKTNRSSMLASTSCDSLHSSSQLPSPSTSGVSIPLARPLVNQGVYMLTFLNCCHPNVSVCYGCPKPLKVKGYETPAPFDLVVVSQMRREFQHDGKTMNKLGNVYFHANIQCLRSRLPFFSPTMVQVQPGLYPYLLPTHKEALAHNLGLRL